MVKQEIEMRCKNTAKIIIFHVLYSNLILLTTGSISSYIYTVEIGIYIIVVFHSYKTNINLKLNTCKISKEKHNFPFVSMEL